MVDVKVKPTAIRATLIATVGLVSATACTEPGPASSEPASPAPPPSVAVPMTPAAPVSRAEFLRAAGAAASAWTAGAAAPEGLVGRRYSLSLAIGCNGPLPSGADDVAGLPRAAWTGPDRSAIALSATAADWSLAPLITGAGGEWEAVEGFWIERPWLLADGCPARPAAPSPNNAAATELPGVGLATLFGESDSRLGRRDGRAHRHVIRRQDGTPPPVPPGGWRLRVEGRVTGFPDGAAFRCQAAGADVRPTCVAAASIDRVAFETADGEVLSEWRPD